MKVGEKVRIHFGGRVYTAIKDDEIALMTDLTITRQIMNIANDDGELNMFSKLLKRGRIESGMDETDKEEGGQGNSKKQKVEERNLLMDTCNIWDSDDDF